MVSDADRTYWRRQKIANPQSLDRQNSARRIERYGGEGAPARHRKKNRRSLNHHTSD